MSWYPGYSDFQYAIGLSRACGIDRPEVDPGPEQVGVLLEIVGERRRGIRQLLRRQRAGTEGALCVAGSTPGVGVVSGRIAAQDHIGADIAHQSHPLGSLAPMPAYTGVTSVYPWLLALRMLLRTPKLSWKPSLNL